ncbi:MULTISPECIES: heme-binding protein [unclassified Rhizobium]|uniref:GlcG/HbpS family heme-binding protein n=1 Tax=unclassified Rhizobium TaxID=2613769 RepID=UPI000BEAE148|nr:MULTISPECIES: heme-binding protein [unclassified Rhizobium]PDT05991.1 DNA polymerase III subunit delta' [Rhizobium sp. M1]PDT29729.1 DNA polymerase III subunit delta' [Rhizobium sp. M10]
MIKLISHEAALKALEAGAAKARELGEPSSLAIVDAGGNLLAFLRADDAALSTVEIAQGKAYTALALRSPSGNWLELVQPGAALYGLDALGGRRPFVVFGGGLPVRDGKTVIGGVGASGGPVEADIAIAEVMVAVLQAG